MDVEMEAAEAALKEIVGDVDRRLEDISTRLDKAEGRANIGGSGIVGDPNAPRYSISKAIRHLSGDGKVDAGYEVEVSQELQRKSPMPMKDAMYVPLGEMTTKLVDFSTEGTDLVRTQHMATQFIDVLRARSTLMQMGITRLNIGGDSIQIPRKTAGSTAYWIGADGADTITESTPTFDKVSMTPKFCSALVKVSYRLALQSSPAIDNMIQQDLADTIAAEIDRAGIQGTGSSNEPTGLINQSGVNIQGYTSGSPSSEGPTWSELVAQEGRLAELNIPGPLEYLFSSNLLAGMKTQDRGTDTGSYVLEGGMVNGYPARHSTNVPDFHVICGHFPDLIMADWGSIAIAMDQGGDNFPKGDISIRAIMPVDFAVRRGASFDIIFG